jgi:hypothetical protein
MTIGHRGRRSGPEGERQGDMIDDGIRRAPDGEMEVGVGRGSILECRRGLLLCKIPSFHRVSDSS